jgi:type IV pilus assembly protein PilY1
MVMVGTGQFLGYSDLSTTQVQTLYGIYDAPPSASPPIGFSGIPTRSNLVQQTISNSTADGMSVRVESSVSSVTLPSSRGWYVDFTLAPGERVVADPKLASGGAVLVTTYQPNTNSCSGGGNAWLMVLNYATGGSFALPELDLNNDGQLNSTDQAGNLNPVGLSLGAVYATSPTVISSASSTGAVGLHIETTNSGANRATTNGARGTGRARTAWWEVRH